MSVTWEPQRSLPLCPQVSRGSTLMEICGFPNLAEGELIKFSWGSAVAECHRAPLLCFIAMPTQHAHARLIHGHVPLTHKLGQGVGMWDKAEACESYCGQI